MSSAAFLTSAFVESPQPTVFEVTAQAGLGSSLQPAVDHLLKVFSAWTPGLRLVGQLRDEIFLLLHSALQLHYLKVYDASFTENFYGLQRAPDDERKKIPLKASFVFLVIVPYIRKKLEELFSRGREDVGDGIQCSSPTATKVRDFYVQIFPTMFFVAKAASLGFLIAFTLKGSKYHSLSSYLAGYHLVYAEPETLKEMEAKSKEYLKRSGGWRKVTAASVQSLAKMLTFGLEVGSFFLQFIDWWYNQERDTRDNITDSVPKPPSPLKGLPNLENCCPICRKKWKAETVLSSSGLVFCYVCIVRYLRKHGKCPVTSLPSKESQLVRIFASSE